MKNINALSKSFFLLVLFFIVANFSFAQNGSCFIEIIAGPGIEVYLDNKYVGTTNSNDNGLFVQNVSSGSHALKFVKEGFQPQRDAIKLKQNQVLPYKVKPFKPSIKISQSGGSDGGKMVLETGTLIIQSLPTAITLKISALDINVQKKQDKVTLDNIPVGTYKAVFLWKGKVLNYNVEIEANENTHLMVNMVNETVEMVGAITDYSTKYNSNQNTNRNTNDKRNNARTEGKPCPDMPTVTDIDGNVYSTVQIGSQCWMKENLKVTHYPNGVAIPYIYDDDKWKANTMKDGAYCYYNNNTDSEYGGLYDYTAAIADSWQKDNRKGQGICPDGWHLPTNREWSELFNSLGGEDIAGGKMKEAGISHWHSPNTGATNVSGFTALPGGRRYDGAFDSAGYCGFWWSATEYQSVNAWFKWLCYNMDYVSFHLTIQSIGLSVRCLRDF